MYQGVGRWRVKWAELRSLELDVGHLAVSTLGEQDRGFGSCCGTGSSLFWED